jgi:hypothetical protein
MSLAQRMAITMFQFGSQEFIDAVFERSCIAYLEEIKALLQQTFPIDENGVLDMAMTEASVYCDPPFSIEDCFKALLDGPPPPEFVLNPDKASTRLIQPVFIDGKHVSDLLIGELEDEWFSSGMIIPLSGYNPQPDIEA